MDGGRLLVHLHRAGHHARHGELPQGTLASLASEPQAQLLVAQQTGQRGAKRRGLARRHDEPCDAVQVGEADAGGQRRGDDRRAGSVGLDLYQAESLAAGHAGQAQHVRRVVPGRQLVIVQRRQERSAGASRRSLPAQLFFQRSPADQDELRVQAAHGAHEHGGALVVDEPPDEEHEAAPAVGGAQLRCAFQDGGRRPQLALGQAEGHHTAPRRARRQERRALHHVARRSHDEVDSIQKPLEKGTVRRQQPLLAHDVAVIQHHTGDDGARQQEGELAPGVRSVEVEHVGRRGTLRLGAQRAGQGRRHRRRRHGESARQPHDVDAVDVLLHALRALVAHESPHVSPGVLDEPLGQPTHHGLNATDVRRAVVLVDHGDARPARGVRTGRRRPPRRRPAAVRTPLAPVRHAAILRESGRRRPGAWAVEDTPCQRPAPTAVLAALPSAHPRLRNVRGLGASGDCSEGGLC